MHLSPCSPPQGSLESAPRTSLRADTPHESWDGFWCLADEGYYTRCRRSDGTEQWYRIAESRVRVVPDSAVLTLRPRSARHDNSKMMLVRPSHGRVPMLIGTSRRGSRSRPTDRAGARG
ncbi:MAG TPA: hypothetical protein VFT29_02535 [Gemmatimonadaceae bacterium]|nr:hypothetical protein [Gemmatimonadaceae bacterium]